MSTLRKSGIALLVVLVALALVGVWLSRGDPASLTLAQTTGTDPVLDDANAEFFPTIAIAEPIGWAAGTAPKAAPGLTVTRFAEGLDHPRTMLTLPNGDVLVALTNSPGLPKVNASKIKGKIEDLLMTRAGAGVPSPDQIVLLRDGDGDGRAEQRSVLARDLASPSGMAYAEGKLYVALHDRVLAYDFTAGQTALAGKPVKLMDLPPGTGHWMRNLELSRDATKLYIAVGSQSNIGENGLEVEEGRAMIWEYDLAGRSARQFATGLRNANGMDFSPWTGELWTVVNERDQLGSDLVPDYLTNVPVGANYGWPWVYWKDQFDRRVEYPYPETINYVRRPEYALGAHVAPLGLVFSAEGARMGPGFSSGAFIARHGSWNRKPLSGYDVIYVAFDARGNPTGQPVPVLTGFLTGEGTTYGRPTWVEWAADGALLVTDDTAGIVWRVIASDARPQAAIRRIGGARLPPQRELRGNTSSFGEDDYARSVTAP